MNDRPTAYKIDDDERSGWRMIVCKNCAEKASDTSDPTTVCVHRTCEKCGCQIAEGNGES